MKRKLFRAYINILEFLKSRNEIYLIAISIGFLILAQALSKMLAGDNYGSFGIAWIEDIVYEHTKAFNVLFGVFLITRILFKKGYFFISETLEKVISGEDDTEIKKQLNLWQRSLLSLLLFFLLILLYIGT